METARQKQYTHTKKPCTGCGGFRWSANGECLNDPCVSEETRRRIFDPSPKKKKRGR